MLYSMEVPFPLFEPLFVPLVETDSSDESSSVSLSSTYTKLLTGSISVLSSFSTVSSMLCGSGSSITSSISSSTSSSSSSYLMLRLSLGESDLVTLLSRHISSFTTSIFLSYEIEESYSPSRVDLLLPPCSDSSPLYLSYPSTLSET